MLLMKTTRRQFISPLREITLEVVKAVLENGADIAFNSGGGRSVDE
tara:strand:+ start:724 stop:861 length:138 start_codon:yes stop_codon:yes gene_type:complete